MAKIKEWEPGTGIYVYHCPACDYEHALYTKERNALNAIWTWNGDLENPTFRPSANGEVVTQGGIEISRCHHFITGGKIQFLKDCTHGFAGKTLDLPNIY